jgi:urea carboxylase
VYSSVVDTVEPPKQTVIIRENEVAAVAQMPGSVWKIVVNVGDNVIQDQTILILESMKMEFHVPSPCKGKVSQILCTQGDQIRQGQQLLLIDTAN